VAVSASWFDEALNGLVSTTAARRFDWTGGDTTKVALTTSTYSISKTTHAFFSSVTNEVSGTGYTAGGATLGSKTRTLDTASDEVRLDAADVSWTTASFTARYAIIYNDTAGASSTDPLLGYVDFGGDETVASGTFQITWAATGVLILDGT
jgi:hypothetical protein